MAIGYSVDKFSVDARLGANVVALRNALEDAVRIDAWLDETPNEALVALGYSQQDIDLARAAYDALHKLADVAYGRVSVPSSDNFFFFAKRLGGVQ